MGMGSKRIILRMGIKDVQPAPKDSIPGSPSLRSRESIVQCATEAAVATPKYAILL